MMAVKGFPFEDMQENTVKLKHTLIVLRWASNGAMDQGWT